MLLASSAVLAGARPGADPGALLRTGGFAAVPGWFTIGLACWLAGAVILSVAWWKLPEGSLRAVYTTGALWAVPLLLAPPLGSRDVYAYACQGWVWWHGQNPYAVGVAAGGCPWASSVPEIWWHTPTPYGPLAVTLAGFAASTGSLLTATVILRLIALVSVLVLALQVPRLAVHCRVKPPMAARLGVITPLVLVHGLSAAHNDALVAALVVLALALAVTRRSISSAALVGLLIAGAVAVKVTAIVVVPFALLLLGRRWVAAAVSAVGGFVVLSLATGLDLGWVKALRGTGELAQWSSPPTAVGMAAGYLVRPFGIEADGPIAVARVAGVVALAGIGLGLVLWAWRHRTDTRKVVTACGLALAATALLGPVFYPWYAITPLAVLAATATTRRAWLAGATVACTFLTLPNGLGVPVLTKAVGAFAITGALAALVIKALNPRQPSPQR